VAATAVALNGSLQMEIGCAEDRQSADDASELGPTGVLVVFNASDEPTTQRIDRLAGREYALSPVLANGSHAVVHGTQWDEATGEVTVPARTVTVLVEKDVPDHGGHPGAGAARWEWLRWLAGGGLGGLFGGVFGGW